MGVFFLPELSSFLRLAWEVAWFSSLFALFLLFDPTYGYVRSVFSGIVVFAVTVHKNTKVLSGVSNSRTPNLTYVDMVRWVRVYM